MDHQSINDYMHDATADAASHAVIMRQLRQLSRQIFAAIDNGATIQWDVNDPRPAVDQLNTPWIESHAHNAASAWHAWPLSWPWPHDAAADLINAWRTEAEAL